MLRTHSAAIISASTIQWARIGPTRLCVRSRSSANMIPANPVVTMPPATVTGTTMGVTTGRARSGTRRVSAMLVCFAEVYVTARCHAAKAAALHSMEVLTE